MENKTKAYLAAGLYACTVGFSFLFIKLALKSASPLDLLAHRFLLAFIAALPPLLLGKVKLSLREFASILPLALFYPASFFLLQTFGLMFIPSSEAGMLLAVVPVLTLALAALWLKERANYKQILFVLLSVAGAVFVSAMKGAGLGVLGLGGSALLLGAALSMAVYAVLARKLAKQFTVYKLTLMMSLTGFLLFHGAALASRAAAGTLSGFFTPFADPAYVIAVLFLGVAASFLSAFLSNYALSELQAAKMSVFSNLATVIAIVAGAVFLKEPLHWYHITGGAAIIVGVLGTNWCSTKEKMPETAQERMEVQ